MTPGIEDLATRVIACSILGLLACCVLVALCVMQSRSGKKH